MLQADSRSEVYDELLGRYEYWDSIFPPSKCMDCYAKSMPFGKNIVIPCLSSISSLCATGITRQWVLVGRELPGVGNFARIRVV